MLGADTADMDFTDRDVKTWKRSDAGGVYYVRIIGLFGWRSSGKMRKSQAVEWALAQATGGHSVDVTVGEYAKNFFLPGDCPVVRLREATGGTATAKHWADLRAALARYILPRWGRVMVAAIDARGVFDWLSDPGLIRAKPEDGDAREWRKEPLSAAHRNRILVAFNLMMDQAVFDRLISANPVRSVPRMRLDSAPRGTFSEAELGEMFPADDDALKALWGGLSWAVLYLVLADTGLRPSEALALRWRDWHPSSGAFVVARKVDDRGQVGPLKTAGKGVAKRVALVRGRTAELLDELNEARGKSRHTRGRWADRPLAPISPDDLIFPADRFADTAGQPMRVAVAGNHFVAALEGLEGFSLAGRTLYCLRHTANTGFRTDHGDDAARLLMGHTNAKMTEHYDHPEDAELVARALKAVGRG